MRILVYLATIGALSSIAWQYPFLFELPLIAAIGGAYWTFLANATSLTLEYWKT
jgi:hypothetical protein